MLKHDEIQLIKNQVSETQYNMLLAIADYNEGWIAVEQLEKKLRTILMAKKNN
jgi:hypothetical protein